MNVDIASPRALAHEDTKRRRFDAARAAAIAPALVPFTTKNTPVSVEDTPRTVEVFLPGAPNRVWRRGPHGTAPAIPPGDSRARACAREITVRQSQPCVHEAMWPMPPADAVIAMFQQS